MTRKEFIKICSLLGLSLPFQNAIAASNLYKNNRPSTNFNGKVLIIGAGAAGLTAAYRLAQMDIDFQLLEASDKYGGRMKIASDFVDFPIPLGAEWVHTKKKIFNEIVNQPSTKVNIETKRYNLTEYALYNGEKTLMANMGLTVDKKFVGSSWLDFFRQYILPSVEERISYKQIVKSIDYSAGKIICTTSKGIFEADKVIISTPVKMLQANSISFSPQLPNEKLEAIKNVTVWDGFKAFIEFSDKFYPVVIESKISPKRAGQKMYYDASYGQNSNHHVLGLFTVGSATLPYRKLSDADLKDYILKELDEQFDNRASASYVKHISQNWTTEPFIGGAYVNDHENWKTVRTLGESVDNKLYFAGTSYTEGEDWGNVHNAARSAVRAVNEILE